MANACLHREQESDRCHPSSTTQMSCGCSCSIILFHVVWPAEMLLEALEASHHHSVQNRPRRKDAVECKAVEHLNDDIIDEEVGGCCKR